MYFNALLHFLGICCYYSKAIAYSSNVFGNIADRIRLDQVERQTNSEYVHVYYVRKPEKVRDKIEIKKKKF